MPWWLGLAECRDCADAGEVSIAPGARRAAARGAQTCTPNPPCLQFQVSEAALAEVAVALLAALAEGFPLETGAQPTPQQATARQQQAGLLIMLATMLRARPGAAVLAAPRLLALGRTLTAPGRLPLLLWALSQAGAVEPAAGVAAWARVLLPQCIGAPLPAPAGKGGAGGGAAPAVARVDAASVEAAAAFVEGLLQRVGPSRAADVAAGGATEPAVPGAALEALARAAAPPAPDVAAAAGKGGGKGGAAAAAAAAANEALAARLHAPLLAVAARSRAGPCAQGEWLLLALETAGLSTAGEPGPRPAAQGGFSWFADARLQAQRAAVARAATAPRAAHRPAECPPPPRLEPPPAPPRSLARDARRAHRPRRRKRGRVPREPLGRGRV
jgi:hypothetical protein